MSLFCKLNGTRCYLHQSLATNVHQMRVLMEPSLSRHINVSSRDTTSSLTATGFVVRIGNATMNSKGLQSPVPPYAFIVYLLS
jgi:hypothetical protein